MPEPIPAIPIPEYGVEPPARRSVRTVALVALLAFGGLLLVMLLLFWLRFASVAGSRLAPAATPARPPALAPAVPTAPPPATAPAAMQS